MTYHTTDTYRFQDHATAVRFRAGRWGITRQDNEAGEAAAKVNKADPTMVKLLKLLINPKTPEYKAIKKNQDSAGNLFRSMAGPWDTAPGGFWIISNVGFAGLQTVMEELHVIHDQLVDDFINALPSILAAAEAKSGHLWDQNLIPSADEIRKKFIFAFDSKILEGDATHATILEMDDRRRAGIVAEAKATTETRRQNLATHTHTVVRKELEEMLAHMKEFGDEIKGTKRKRSFKNGLIERMRALCALLPALNINGDPRLEKLANEIAKNLTDNTGEALRGNRVKGDTRPTEVLEAEAAKKREAAADATADILAKLDGVFGDPKTKAA